MPRSESSDLAAAKRYLHDVFGISRSALEHYILLEKGNDVWLVRQQKHLPLNITSEGIRILRKTTHTFKPTTYALQFFQKNITKGTALVTYDELLALLAGESIRLKGPRGFVAIQYKKDILGCGFSNGEELVSQIPKTRAKELLSFLQSSTS